MPKFYMIWIWAPKRHPSEIVYSWNYFFFHLLIFFSFTSKGKKISLVINVKLHEAGLWKYLSDDYVAREDEILKNKINKNTYQR